MTWGEFQGNTVEDRAKLDTIPGKENFGFTCDEDHGKYDWGNLSTDIWKGDKTDDPNPYPPDVTDPTKDPNKTDFATYDEYTEFTFVNPEDNGELVDFVFSVIYEISKEQAIKALDNLDICYGPIEVDNGGEIQETSTRITASDVKVSLALADEFYLGRDYENGQKEYELKAPAQLVYTGGAFSIQYAYDSSRKGGNLTYTMDRGAVDAEIDYRVQYLLDQAVFGSPEVSTGIELSLGTTGEGSAMVITDTYDLKVVGTLSEMQATGAIDMVGAALSKLSSVRSLFGAEQNRLEHAYAINLNSHENTQSAESSIRDTDMAKEMIRFSNANILEQSGNSMLVQANQANNIVLSLLQ